VYDPNIPQLLDSDPASASNVFNPLFLRLITNIHALRVVINALTGYDLSGAVGTFAQLPPGAGLPAGTLILVWADENHGGQTTVYQLNATGQWEFLEVFTAFSSHIGQLVYSEDGVHGLRYYDGVLYVFNGSTWESVTEEDTTERFDDTHYGADYFVPQ